MAARKKDKKEKTLTKGTSIYHTPAPKLPQGKADSLFMERFLSDRERAIKDRERDINKLKKNNEIMINDLKVMSRAIDENLEKARVSSKGGPPPFKDMPKARRDHELDSINKLLENYKKEKTYMSKKLEKECGYERLILMEKEILDLEGQLSKLTKEKKVLKREVEKSEQEISKAQLKEMATKGNKITESISPEETRINKQTKNALQKQFRLEKKLNEIEINDMHIEKHIKELKYKTKIEEKKAAVRGKRNYESDVSKSATVRNESRIDVSETDVEEVKEENLELKNEFEDWKRESETEILSWKRRVGDIKKKKEDFNKVYTANLHRLGELRKLYIIESQKERRAQSVIGNPITPVPDSETRRVNDIREARAKYSRMKFKARSPSPHSKKSEAPAREETINNPKATESREKTVTPNEDSKNQKGGRKESITREKTPTPNQGGKAPKNKPNPKKT